MIHTTIGVIILCCAGAGIGIFLLCADAILGLRHRGEADEAPLGDDAYALTRPLPLEHVPDRPDPDLTDFERDMAATVAARLAIHLTYRSPR
jgi:hypothetical protein